MPKCEEGWFGQCHLPPCVVPAAWWLVAGCPPLCLSSTSPSFIFPFSFSLSCSVFILFPAVCAPAGTLAYTAGLELSVKCPQDWDAPALTLIHGAHYCSQMHPQFPAAHFEFSYSALVYTEAACCNSPVKPFAPGLFFVGRFFNYKCNWCKALAVSTGKSGRLLLPFAFCHTSVEDTQVLRLLSRPSPLCCRACRGVAWLLCECRGHDGGAHSCARTTFSAATSEPRSVPFYFCHFHGCEVASDCGFSLHFPDDCDTEHLFTCCAIYTSLRLFKCLVHFKNRALFAEF